MGGGRAAKLALLLTVSVGVGLLLAVAVIAAGWLDTAPRDSARATDRMQAFCEVLSGEVMNDDPGWYERSLAPTSSTLDADDAALVAEAVADHFVELVPVRYHAGIRQAVDGLERAITGDLTRDEARSYVAAFERLQRQAAGDCEPYRTDGE